MPLLARLLSRSVKTAVTKGGRLVFRATHGCFIEFYVAQSLLSCFLLHRTMLHPPVVQLVPPSTLTSSQYNRGFEILVGVIFHVGMEFRVHTWYIGMEDLISRVQQHERLECWKPPRIVLWRVYLRCDLPVVRTRQIPQNTP